MIKVIIINYSLEDFSIFTEGVVSGVAKNRCRHFFLQLKKFNDINYCYKHKINSQIITENLLTN